MALSRPTRSLTLTAALFILALALAQPASAQPSATATPPPTNETFSFGHPLRDNILFAYKYTEKVRTWLSDADGAVTDSSERVLTYFITQRQKPGLLGGGAIEVEANIDSMRLDYRGAAGAVEYDNMILDHGRDLARLRHPAVLVPSTLVNSVAHFQLSPYGTMIDMKSISFDNLRVQAEDPSLDDFTYKRLGHMLDNRYLATVFFPWRNVLPLGRDIGVNKTIRVPMLSALDRIVFTDSADVTLIPAADGGQPVLNFTTPLTTPVTEWITYEGQSDPVLLSGSHGIITGQLMLDPDGVVTSGWSMANGTATGSARGQAVNARFEHQVYVELMRMTAFAVE